MKENDKKQSVHSLYDYVTAFKNQKKTLSLKQKELAEKWSRTGPQLSTLFSIVEMLGASGDINSDEKNKHELNRILVKFKETFSFNPDGTLELIGGIPSNPIIIHKNYEEAEIGKHVFKAGTEVCLINTFLAYDLVHKDADETSIKTLKNWLKVQNKKVRVIVLRPDGKGMMLRAKSSLGSNGAALVNDLIQQLESLLELQTELPNQLEVRLVDEIPGVSGVILENKAFFGLHLAFGHTEQSTWHEITSTEHYSYKNLKKHFDELWKPDRSMPLTADEIDHLKRALNIARGDLGFLTANPWKVYLHEMTMVIKGNRAAPFADTTGEVSIWDLKLTKPDRGIYLIAELKTSASEQPLKAKLITEKLGNSDYAHCRFTVFERFSIHLTFNCRLEDQAIHPLKLMLGYYVISAGADACSGYIALQHTSDNLDVNEEPTEVVNYLNRLLTFRDSSYFSLHRTRSEMTRFSGMPHKGTYKVYSYGGKRDGGKCIKVNWLKIDEIGVATYKNQRFPKGLIGRATLIDGKLHIVFNNTNTNKQRRSYLIISVPELPVPRDTYYSAVHLGVSEDPSMPIGKRFILEYLENVDFEGSAPFPIALHSDDYKKLKDELKKLLSGRVKNLLGFLRKEGNIKDYIDIKAEWEESIQMSEVFYESALWKARKREDGLVDPNAVKDAADMILRAVNHGFDQMTKFDDEIARMNPAILKQIQETKYYKTIQDILNHYPPSEMSPQI